ncbi:hypothetical protein [Paracoccus pantotrophus]|uniref:hypothetical protein n=1 Tax=Paracoccus pantotrophus TaxID=82367 RepID=UPI0004B5B5A6|nr:hypothetical protein [Paracoccus pantotrophus]
MRIPSRKKVVADKVKDALGVCAVFGIMVAGFWIAYGLGLPTGGDELMGVV